MAYFNPWSGSLNDINGLAPMGIGDNVLYGNYWAGLARVGHALARSLSGQAIDIKGETRFGTPPEGALGLRGPTHPLSPFLRNFPEFSSG